jgi:3-hydroxybutyrate dehydrogenase
LNEHPRAIVTGAASGIGRAVAEALASAGVLVAVVDQDQTSGAAVAAAIGGHFIEADLSQGDACRHVVDETLRHLGGVDILVNNAGFQHCAA